MNKTAVSVPGWRIVRHETIGSTNEEAKRLAVAGCAARTVVWADEQHEGKGRHGRSWASPPGNLYISVVLRPSKPQSDNAQVGFVAALALAETIRELLPEAGRALTLKWPNDVLINGAKVSGILLEGQGGSGKEAWVVLGIGVNVASHPAISDRPATSLGRAGYSGSVEKLLRSLMANLMVWLDTWEKDGFGAVRDAWLRHAAADKPITVRLGPETLAGTFTGIDERGALILDQNGRTRIVTAGEVFESAH